MNPELLPKIRSEALRRSAKMIPCTLRIASFLGLSCAGQDTNVMAHLPTFGKGMATKVSDLFMACACHTCHDLLDDERDRRGAIIRQTYPHAYFERLFRGHCETQAHWIQLGLLVVPDADLVI